jgi:hypothetical protein
MKMWFNDTKDLDKTIGEHKWLITIALFGFVFIKVIFIARGNVQIALGIFNSAGTTTVVAGGILSAFPLVSAVAFGLTIFQLTRSFLLTADRSRTSGTREPCEPCEPTSKENKEGQPSGKWHVVTEWARKEKLAWLALLAATVACFFITPWLIATTSAILGIIAGIAAKITNRTARRISFFFLLLASISLVLYPLLYAVWLPHEKLDVPQYACPRQGDNKYVVGYVLSDSNGWISLLISGQRNICRLKTQQVTARTLCQANIVSMPRMLDWYKNGDTPEKAILSHTTMALPRCP